MPRIPPAREGNPSLSPTTTISGSRAPTHPRLILAVRWRPYSRLRHTRFMGRRTPRVGGSAPMAVTHLEEAGGPFYIF